MSEQQPKLDVAIVGGGMAGLIAGCLLAGEGVRAGVFERHSKLGGYAQYFGHDVCWDATTHFIGGAGEGGWFHDPLAKIGLFERLPLRLLEPAYRVIAQGEEFVVPSDAEALRLELSARFPAEADGLARFFADVRAIGDAYPTLASSSTEPLLAKNADRTAAQLLADYTGDERLTAILAATWLFGGLPPEQFSALHFAMQLHTLHFQGGVAAVRGNMREHHAVMAEFIAERGGLVENLASVRRILHGRGGVTGVELEDGRIFKVGAAISTANPTDTFERFLAGDTVRPLEYAPLRVMVTSVSALQVHVLTDAPMETPTRLTLAHWGDAFGEWADLQRPAPRFDCMAVSVLDHGDPERAPAGRRQVSITTLAPYARDDNWFAPWDLRRTKAYRVLPDYTQHKEDVGDRLVARAAELFPGLDGPTEYRRVGTPITLERYTFNTAGAAFGWANLPQQCGANRPGCETPLRGLYLAGHWTFPGAGIAPVALSARLAAEAVLRGRP